MSDLVDFLRARLDEDEQIALAVQKCECGRCEEPLTWAIDSDGRWIQALGLSIGHTIAPGYINAEQAAHIVHQDPARALREVEAKRRLIEFIDDLQDRMTMADYFGDAEEPVLRLLALPYSDHAGWREEWRPDAA